MTRQISSSMGFIFLLAAGLADGILLDLGKVSVHDDILLAGDLPNGPLILLGLLGFGAGTVVELQSAGVPYCAGCSCGLQLGSGARRCCGRMCR